MTDARAAATAVDSELDQLRASLPPELADLPSEFVELASIVIAQHHRGHACRPLLRVLPPEVRQRLQAWIGCAGDRMT